MRTIIICLFRLSLSVEAISFNSEQNELFYQSLETLDTSLAIILSSYCRDKSIEGEFRSEILFKTKGGQMRGERERERTKPVFAMSCSSYILLPFAILHVHVVINKFFVALHYHLSYLLSPSQ